MNYHRARYYNPNIGRFVSEDPIVGAAISLFSYVTNSPVRFTDPSGLYRIINEIKPQDIRNPRSFRYACGADAAGECADKNDFPGVAAMKCFCSCDDGVFRASYEVTLKGAFYVYAGPWAALNVTPCVDKNVTDRDSAEAHANTFHLNVALKAFEWMLVMLEARSYPNYDACKEDCGNQLSPLQGKYRQHLNNSVAAEREECNK